MKTKREHKAKKSRESGNVLIYVLIAIALFAGLSFTLSKQSTNDSGENLDEANAEFYAAQIISYAAQARSAIDQMVITGTAIDDFNFDTPDDSSFETAPLYNKVFHPEGGGLSTKTLPKQAVYQISTTPAAGWYIGRFNNVEWTKTSATDIMLTAYQIQRPVCEAINRKITGSSAIPVMNGNMSSYIVDTTTNNDVTIAACPNCEGYSALCVTNIAVNAYSYYTLMAER